MKDKPVILVVDDQPQNIELLEAYLVPQDYEIITAANGAEALGKISGNQIDLVLLDVMMPGMDGFEVTRRVRQDNTQRMLPIILVTALRETEDRVKGIEAGCDDFLSKPVDKIELLARVRSLLKVKAYNDLMSNYRKELESEVTRRTEELKQAEGERKNLLEQLVRSEKLAAVGELIAGVAHEINNPLTGIVGLSELLLMENKKNLDEDTRKDLESIYQSSERIRKIVANLLRFARREAPARKDANINELLDTVLNIRSYEMKVRNVELKKNYQPDLPLVMADPSQLEQVFLNLITNAEYAIHEIGKAGTLTIATSLQEEQPEHKKVIIEIDDTGAGIPEGVLTRIFNPFFTTKPVGKGTGLGLSVSYGIIKEHGGEINVRNRAEGGAVFTIELPVQVG